MFGLRTGAEIERNKEGIVQERKIKQEKISKEAEKQAKEIQEKFEKIWGNINNYDGTSTSQKEVK